MKSISQLLDLSKNPYYVFTSEERAALDAFLSKNSEQKPSAKDSSTNSEKNIPAIVRNNNIVRPEKGDIPTMDNTVDKHQSESEAVEDLVHPDAVLEGGETEEAAESLEDKSATVDTTNP